MRQPHTRAGRRRTTDDLATAARARHARRLSRGDRRHLLEPDHERRVGRPTGNWERRSLELAIAYCVIAATWIATSDIALSRIVEDGAALGVVKGLGFVGVTSLLLLTMSQRWGQQIDEHLLMLWRERTISEIASRVDSELLATGDLDRAIDSLCDALVELVPGCRVEPRQSETTATPVIVAGVIPADDSRRDMVLTISLGSGANGRTLTISNDNLPIGNDARRIVDAVTQRLTNSVQFAEQQRQLVEVRGAVEAAASAVAIVLVDRTIRWANKAFWELTGYTAADLDKRTVDVLVEETSVARAGRIAWRTIRAGRPWVGELLMRRRDGSLYAARHTLTPITDDFGNIVHVISVHNDLTKQRHAEQRLAHLATHDSLTSLPNRALFLHRVAQHLDTPDHTPAAVLVIGLIDFTDVNEVLGDLSGDVLLRSVAERLRDMCRLGEEVASVHGDQFAVLLLGHQKPGEVAIRARALLEAVSQPIVVAGNDEVVLRARAGLALHPQDGPTADALVTHATTAMRGARRTGESRLQFHSVTHNEAAEERLSLHRDLRRALAMHEFVLHFQPQIDLTTRQCIGMEALIRWDHPTRGLMLPARFIHVVDESDLSASVNRWVLATALAACKELRALNPTARVGVNISAAHFIDGDVVHFVRSTLAASGLPPDALEVELLESTLFTGGVVPVAMRELRALGVRLAVDDFGTGYNTLSRVSELPMDVVKIDRSFVSGVDTNPKHRAIIKAIMSIAEALDATVLAEGVETGREERTLVELGCHSAQGYFFGRPAPIGDLLTTVARQQPTWAGSDPEEPDTLQHVPGLAAHTR